MRRTSSWLPLPVGLLVVAVLVALTPDPATEHRVSWVAGELGTPVVLPDYTVQASNPRVARAFSVFGEELSGDGVVVAVDLTVELHRGELTYPQVELLTTDGRWYAERSENPAGTSPLEPGWASVGTSVFVVPADRLRGASLRVTADSAPGSGREPDVHTTGVRVDLGLDDPAALTTDRTPPIELLPTEPVVA